MRTALLLGVSLAAATPAVRSVYLNGVDISSAKSQDLKNVDIHISETGDVFIIAPHYQVNEEDTYVPLSKYVQGLNAPQHKAPQKIGDELKGGALRRIDDAPVAKAGEPLSPPAAAGEIGAAPAAGGLAPKAGMPAAPAAVPAAGEAMKADDQAPLLPEDGTVVGKPADNK